MKHAIAVLIKIRFAFTGFILSFKMTLITNRIHRGAYNWCWGGGGGAISGGEEAYNRLLRYVRFFSQAR